MKPEELAIKHSASIDQKIGIVESVGTAMKFELTERLQALFAGLKLDQHGRCVVCKENRVILNRASVLLRETLRKNRPMIVQAYSEGVTEIENSTRTYIGWLRNQKTQS